MSIYVFLIYKSALPLWDFSITNNGEALDIQKLKSVYLGGQSKYSDWGSSEIHFQWLLQTEWKHASFFFIADLVVPGQMEK